MTPGTATVGGAVIELQVDGVPAQGTITADAELGVTSSALGTPT